MIPNKGTIQHRTRISILCVICACILLLNGCTKSANDNTPAQSSNTEAIPKKVGIQKVIEEVALKDGYHKKIELLTDGGKQITITDPNQKIVLRQIEYDGKIITANGKQITVQVEDGEERTITIPDNVVIEDEDKHQLKKNVEIEWTVNTNGQIESVDLGD